jgi:sucrose phosphorylase
MQSIIAKYLETLYGKSAAQTVLPQLNAIINQRATRIGASRRHRAQSSLSERDVLLITYPDQVREDMSGAGVPPLQTLTTWLDTHLASIVSGVHLLPFYPFSSDDGFSVVDYFAVDPSFGDWDDVERLGRRFDLMFDAVINHVSAQSEWFQRFLQDDPGYRDFFITVEGDADLSQVVRPRALPLLTEFETPSGAKKVWTTFSPDQIDLNFKNPSVLLRVLDALLFYIERGARFIRLDAIAYLWKEIGTPCIHLPQTHTIIQLIRAILDEVAPDVLLITETNVPHAENISYFGDGTNEAQLVYNFALPPLVLHAFHTGDAAALSRWAQTLTLPSDRVTFFNFLASHDGIGVTPARGILSDAEIDALVTRAAEHDGFVSYKQNADGSHSPYELNLNYFDALSNPNNTREPAATQVNRFIASQAIMLSLVGVPGIYFHSLFGSRNDRASAVDSGTPRRINRQKLTRAELARDLADPESLRARVFSRYAELLRARRAHRAFHPQGRQEIIHCGKEVFAVRRIAPEADERVLCLHNVADQTVQVKLTGNKEEWKDLIGGRVHTPNADGEFAFELQPYQIVWAQVKGNES